MKLHILLAISVLLIYPASAFAESGDVTIGTDLSEYTKGDTITISAVSYTHLTLPTLLLV